MTIIRSDKSTASQGSRICNYFRRLTINGFLPEKEENQAGESKTATPGNGGNHPGGKEKLEDGYKDNMSPLGSQAGILREGEVI